MWSSVTPEPVPGADQSTLPSASVDNTVTSADPLPALIVTLPSESAVNTGGSDDDSATTDGLLVVHVRPVAGAPAAFTACSVRVCPIPSVSAFGISVICGPLATGTVNVTALLHLPF